MIHPLNCQCPICVNNRATTPPIDRSRIGLVNLETGRRSDPFRPQAGRKAFEIAFVDLDGVLVDWHSAAFAAHGRTLVEAEYPIGLWNTWEFLGLSGAAEFWKAIDGVAGFWESLLPLPWIDRVLEIAWSLADEVKIATSPSANPAAYSGKRAWCDRYLGGRFELILCRSKHLLARPDRILIDDADHNCDAFTNEGGRALLFPRRWNMLHPFYETPVVTLAHHASRYLAESADAFIHRILTVPELPAVSGPAIVRMHGDDENGTPPDQR